MANTKNSIYLSDDLQRYLEQQVDAFGMGKSAYISMILTFYRQQVESLAQASKMQDYLNQLGNIVEASKNSGLLDK